MFQPRERLPSYLGVQCHCLILKNVFFFLKQLLYLIRLDALQNLTVQD